MGTFAYSSLNMRTALFLECKKDFERIREKVLQDFRQRITEELCQLVAKYSLEMQQQESAMDRGLDIRINIVGPKEVGV